eukprot:364358-Chlamydomonas_euryale.AAC.17
MAACARPLRSARSLRRRCADDKRTRHCMWRAARGIPFDTMHSTQVGVPAHAAHTHAQLRKHMHARVRVRVCV